LARPGWIKLYYSLLENPMWEKDKPFTEGQAWVDLLLLAAYDEHTDNGIKWMPGEVHISKNNLAKRWGWSRRKIDECFAAWEEENMIGRTFEHGFERGSKMVLTIANWAKFQGQRSKSGRTSGRTFEPQPKNIYKNSDGSGVKNPRPHARKKPPVGGDVELVKVNGEWVAKPR